MNSEIELDKIIELINNNNRFAIFTHESPDGDAIGSVILMSKDANTKMTDIEKKVAQSAATFLGSQMEI